ncbi:MAG: A/G-specific adenine glycosylase [Aureliella sp.]
MAWNSVTDSSKTDRYSAAVRPEMPEAAAFRRKLLRWYNDNARDLPWRRTHDPYAIWISEIMLQQTQVATVIDYYKRFLERFPTPTAVAEAAEEEVLSYWSGLGYYRRARQLHAAAKEVVGKHDGVFPTTLESIQELPGIGRYTASAIYSFSCDGRAAIVEANTARLYARLMGLEEDVSTPKAQKALWQFAESVIPKRGSGTGQCNQALIELGSQLCTPQAPRCMICPVRNHCVAYEHGLQDRIPAPKKKKEVTQLVHAMVILRCEDQVLLRQNEAGQWWHGLWEFARLDMTNKDSRRRKVPATPKSRREPILTSSEVQTELWDQHHIECSGAEFQTVFSHAVTRYRIRLECFIATAKTRLETAELEGVWQWCPIADLGLPLSAPSQRVQRQLLE